jgi:hypothetical protein
MSDLRQQELDCHNCGKYVRFMLDHDLDGSHILNCPNCDHEHYRIIRNGRITAERWGRDPRQGDNGTPSGVYFVSSYAASSIGTSSTSLDTFWLNDSSTSTGAANYTCTST